MNFRSVRVASMGVVTLAGLLAPVAAADAALVVYQQGQGGTFTWALDGAPLFTTPNTFDITQNAAQTGAAIASGFRYNYRFAFGSGTITNSSIASWGGASAIALGSTVGVGPGGGTSYTIARGYLNGESVGGSGETFAGEATTAWRQGPNGYNPLLGSSVVVGLRVNLLTGVHFGWALLNWDGLSYQPQRWAWQTIPQAPALVPTPAAASLLLAAGAFAARRRRAAH